MQRTTCATAALLLISLSAYAQIDPRITDPDSPCIKQEQRLFYLRSHSGAGFTDEQIAIATQAAKDCEDKLPPLPTDPQLDRLMANSSEAKKAQIALSAIVHFEQAQLNFWGARNKKFNRYTQATGFSLVQGAAQSGAMWHKAKLAVKFARERLRARHLGLLANGGTVAFLIKCEDQGEAVDELRCVALRPVSDMFDSLIDEIEDQATNAHLDATTDRDQ